MRIAITGTPSTGKTEVSKLLSKKLGYDLIQINELANRLNAFLGYDKKRGAKIIDLNRLKNEINKLKGNFIIEGHASHFLPVDLVIVLRCNPEILKERLEKKYPKNKLKVKENLEAEILGVITSEAIMNNGKVYEIDTSNKKPERVVNGILKILKGKTEEFKVGKIDWLEQYVHMIDLKTYKTVN
ncbi:MAG: hypothetical protein AYK18_02905 [Theionarchaea archaeon DG-70]|nr:MAG: hypothetical protein AYK18_02905 [Theionarchaea archaeon DG-70]